VSFPAADDELGPGVYWAARVEDAVGLRLNRLLRRRGWQPRVVTYTGYGTQEWARVLARVLLAPAGVRTREVAGARGWRRFLAATAPGVRVTVEIGGQHHEVVSERGGYIDTVLTASLDPGWAQASLAAEGSGRPPSSAPIRVVGDSPGVGLVSDIDDTVVITALPRPLVAFWNTFLRRETSRRPVPGMAQMYRAVLESEPAAFVVYLSTGAWNVAPGLQEFLARHGYPRGPMLLTDWGPTTQAMFRSGIAHKHDQLQRLFAELPQLRWLLVGDDGQHDPQIYGDSADAAPDRVEAVAIRQLTPGEQVRTHGATEPLKGQHTGERRSGSATGEVEQVRAPDGFGLLEQLRVRRLLGLRVR